MEQDLFGKCPFATTQRILQGKWAILIMHHLEEGPVRFNELQRRLPHMTHATLSRQLKQLETDGVVLREEYAQIPPKVEYRLSPNGEEFREVLDSVRSWGTKYTEATKETD